MVNTGVELALSYQNTIGDFSYSIAANGAYNKNEVGEIPTADGLSVAVWEVNANWLNLTDGDVYGPGRDGDGGVYYISVNPGDGVPPVIEYVNSGGIIAWDGVRRNK